MSNQPIKVTFFSQDHLKRKTIHLVTQTKEKSLKFALANCRQWVINNPFPFTIRVTYGFYQTKRGVRKEITNEMSCKTYEDYEWALQAFLREYYE